MTEGELREVAFAILDAAGRPGGEPLVDALHRLLVAADAALAERGIVVLRCERAIPPPGGDGPA